MSSAIRIQNLSFSYKGTQTQVLKEINLDIKKGEFVALQGPSGSGKSTLLYLLGCLLNPDQGSIHILDKDISRLTSDELADLRNRHIGFVFQQFHLLPRLNVIDNILLPTYYAKPNDTKVNLRQRAMDLIKTLGLEGRVGHLPNQLSGGQQQRVAIARALINNPEIIFADEPTGNLDSKTAEQILVLLRQLNTDMRKTVVIITHDNDVASKCDRIISIKDGTIKGLSHSVESNKPLIEEKRQAQKMENSFTFSQYLWAIKNYFPTAIGNLGRSKIRTALTMVGISVGVAAVLSMITLGQFTKKRILAGYAELGVNTLLFYGYPNWEQRATDLVPVTFRFFDWNRDLLPLRKIFPQIRLMSPLLIGWDSSVNFGGRSIDSEVRVVGSGEEALTISNRKLIYGRNFTSDDIERKHQVCIVGYEIGQRLFSSLHPLGQVLRVTQGSNSFGCRVIGVLASVTSNKEWSKPNLEIVVPFTFFQALSGEWWASQIKEVIIQVAVNSDIEKTGRGIRSFFEQKYGVSGRFRVDSDSILIAQMKRFLDLFTLMLGAIALVTLGVGGIGITNMMLVSVSERFREIGLRKAIGATDKSIRIQFLTEAIAVCLIAGFIGLIGGFAVYQGAIWSASKFVSKLQFEWAFDGIAVVISIISILAVGLLSGLFPALKAEKLQVIEALRSE